MSKKIGFIGAGQMAQALASGFIRGGVSDGDSLAACDPLPAAREAFSRVVEGASAFSEHSVLAEHSEVIFLAVKPQYLAAACESLAPSLDGQLVVSIVAGAPLYELERLLSTDRLVRVMPNTPCLIGAGASGFSLADGAKEEDRALVQQLLEAVGLAVCVPEAQLDAVTGVSGSGPAYVFLMLEAMADGGVRMGLPREVAMRLAAQTITGAAQLQIETGEHPGVLKDRVASPGGSTIAGLHVLEDHGVRGAMMSAVEAAASRAEELG